MTLLTICQSVARDIGELAPASIINNEDKFAAQLLALANRAGKYVAGCYDWTILQRENTFTVTSGTAEYALPDDFDHFLGETAWDRTAYWEMRGPLSPQEWQRVKSGLAQTSALRKRWRVKRSGSSIASTFFLDPTPSNSTDSLVYEYVSSGWCKKASDNSLQTAWALDSDLGVISENLIELDLRWRILERLGRAAEAATAKKEAASEIDVTWAQDGGAPVLSLAPADWSLPPVNVPETGFG